MNNLTQEIQNLIVLTSHQYLMNINKVFYFGGTTSLKLVCLFPSQHISIWTDYTASAQQPQVIDEWLPYWLGSTDLGPLFSISL